MLKIYVATTTETMLVSNLPCWKFKKYARMPMACMLNVHNVYTYITGMYHIHIKYIS